MVNRTNPEFINRIKFSPSPSIDKERINITLIQNTDIKDAYTNVVKRVSEFEKKMEEAEQVGLSLSEKRRALKNSFGINYYFKPFWRISNPSDRLFQRFYSIRNLDNTMQEEIKRYIQVLDRNSNVFNTPTTITIDINDVVSNPKMNSFQFQNGKSCGVNIVDISRYLYSEPDKHKMSWYFKKLGEHWKENGQTIYWLNNHLYKLGTRFDAFGNGSHILNTMQIARNSGLSDKDLGLPHGYIESLTNVKVDIIGNTSDDLEFVLLFNYIHKLFSDRKIDEEFYIKSASQKGLNIIGIKGKDISIQTKQQLIDYASLRLSEVKSQTDRSQIIY